MAPRQKKIGHNTSDGCGDYPMSVRGMAVQGGDEDFYVQKHLPSGEERAYEAEESGLLAPHEIVYGG